MIFVLFVEIFILLKRLFSKKGGVNMDEYTEGLRVISACNNVIQTDKMKIWRDTVDGIQRILYDGQLLKRGTDGYLVTDTEEALHFHCLLNSKRRLDSDTYLQYLAIYDALSDVYKKDAGCIRVYEAVTFFLRYKQVLPDLVGLTIEDKTVKNYYVVLLNLSDKTGYIYAIKGDNPDDVLKILLCGY